MKSLLTLIVLSVSILVTTPSFATEQKKVCEKVKDAKTGKEKEICKTIKIHKKLEVEDKKK
jgi:competence protein ComGC